MKLITPAYGEHVLQTFEEPRFAQFKLSQEAEGRRTHWVVEHFGHQFKVIKENNDGALMHILADPVRRGRLITVRQKQHQTSGATITIHALGFDGVEQRLGHAQIIQDTEHSSEPTPYFLALRVEPFLLRKATSRSSTVEEAAKEQARLIKAIAAKTEKLKREPSLEGLAQLEALRRQSLELFKHREGLRSAKGRDRHVYRYRGIGLGEMLVSLAEEIAQKSGYSRMLANFQPSNVGWLATKRGWKKIEGTLHEKVFR